MRPATRADLPIPTTTGAAARRWRRDQNVSARRCGQRLARRLRVRDTRSAGLTAATPLPEISTSWSLSTRAL